MRLAKRVTGACALLLLSTSVARAGGTDLPDNGTEAIGRGGAFTAKADNGLALYYNVAGLARQRGTRVTVDANLVLYNTTFTRDGVYGASNAPGSGAWVGKSYPGIGTSENVFPIPYLGISTDFGFFKRWTFGFGVYGPPGVGKLNYGVNTSGSETATVKLADGTIAPAPSRYDISRTNLLIFYPTLAVAVSPMKWFDLGLAIQAVYGNFDLANANVTRAGSACASLEDPQCDAYGNIKASGWSWGLIASAMVHPTPYLDIGVSFRPQIDIHAEGNIHATTPPALQVAIPDAPVTFNTMQPNVLRLGARYVNRYADETERFDIEVDGIWENWGKQTDRWGRSWDSYDSPNKYTPDLIYSDNFMLGAGGELKVNLNHGYTDVFGVRVGGAYNHRLSEISRLIGRLGFYYDSAATDDAHTRLDFNTAAKIAATIGGGYRWRGLTVNIAYAFIYTAPRTVTNSVVRPVDSNFGTEYPTGYPVDIVGNGKYVFSNHIISLGLTVNFNEFKRPTLFAN